MYEVWYGVAGQNTVCYERDLAATLRGLRAAGHSSFDFYRFGDDEPIAPEIMAKRELAQQRVHWRAR